MRSLELLLVLALGYISLVVSDFIIHRYVWHGRFRLMELPGFRSWLRPHFAHHLVAHHHHSVESARQLFAGLSVPTDRLRKMEDRFTEDPLSLEALRCSDHGVTIATATCVANYVSLFALTPHCALLFVLLCTGELLEACMVAGLTGVTVFTQINHRFYHMTETARRQHSPRHLRWFFLSAEFDRLARDHQAHHYSPQAADDHYSVLPLSRYILRPFLGRD